MDPVNEALSHLLPDYTKEINKHLATLEDLRKNKSQDPNIVTKWNAVEREIKRLRRASKFYTRSAVQEVLLQMGWAVAQKDIKDFEQRVINANRPLGRPLRGDK